MDAQSLVGDDFRAIQKCGEIGTERSIPKEEVVQASQLFIDRAFVGADNTVVVPDKSALLGKGNSKTVYDGTMMDAAGKVTSVAVAVVKAHPDPKVDRFGEIIEENKLAQELERKSDHVVGGSLRMFRYEGSSKGEKVDKLCVVMEKMDSDLLKVAKDADVDLKERLEYLRQTSVGLSDIHKWGAHCDIGPRNIFLIGGQVKVGDLGAAATFENLEKQHKKVLASGKEDWQGLNTLLPLTPQEQIEAIQVAERAKKQGQPSVRPSPWSFRTDPRYGAQGVKTDVYAFQLLVASMLRHLDPQAGKRLWPKGAEERFWNVVGTVNQPTLGEITKELADVLSQLDLAEKQPAQQALSAAGSYIEGSYADSF